MNQFMGGIGYSVRFVTVFDKPSCEEMPHFEHLARRVVLFNSLLIDYFGTEVALTNEYEPKSTPPTGEEDGR